MLWCTVSERDIQPTSMGAPPIFTPSVLVGNKQTLSYYETRRYAIVNFTTTSTKYSAHSASVLKDHPAPCYKKCAMCGHMFCALVAVASPLFHFHVFFHISLSPINEGSVKTGHSTKKSKHNRKNGWPVIHLQLIRPQHLGWQH